jgi:glycine/D-amino acid oxidase-like deaminating enzyme
MKNTSADVVICGAGIAGVATAYALTVTYGVDDVLLLDERPPLSLTSSSSTECYRNWWPGPDDAMVRLMNHSIDLIEDLARSSGNVFNLNRRGYLYATAHTEIAEELEAEALQLQGFDAGPLRKHDGGNSNHPYHPYMERGFEGQPIGADLIRGQSLIQEHFPYLNPEIETVLHVRRAGWLSAHQLGALMLQRAHATGLRRINARVVGVERDGGRVCNVRVGPGSETSNIATRNFVNAAGPFCNQVAGFLDVDLPVQNERHLSLSLKDRLDLFPRAAPMLIWCDEQRLAWTPEERAELDRTKDRWLLEPFPPGLHARPEGSGESRTVLALWPYDTPTMRAAFPVPSDPAYPTVVLRGMQALLPGFSAYEIRLPSLSMDGGYYTKTKENRPLVGPLHVEGAWIIAALSGFGIMASAGCGDILGASIAEAEAPDFTPRFSLARYEDPDYVSLIDAWEQPFEL